MDFKDKLQEYLKQLDITAKALSESSGLSAATLSRYRCGQRVPGADSDNLARLIQGIVRIAEHKKIAGITVQSVSDDFSPLAAESEEDLKKMRANFNALLTSLSVSISELAGFLGYNPSYISRIKNGQRNPARPAEFAWGAACFISGRYQSKPDKTILADLIGCGPEELDSLDNYRRLLAGWLACGTEIPKDYLVGFLEKFDRFDLNDYVRALRFDEWETPEAPSRLPDSKSYFGLKEMMDSDLDFLRETVLSGSREPVIMYSDMPLGEMADDPEFPKKWMAGMAMMLKKGLRLNQIHHIDRSFGDMMLGLESWIPMYMTGLISPYYLKEAGSGAFSHILKVSGSVALAGEAVRGYQEEGKYYLTRKREEVAYYKRQAERLLSKASPLMEIYRQNRAGDYSAFWQEDSKTEGRRRFLLSSLPLHTATEDLICRILQNNRIDDTEQAEIIQYAARQREIANEILSHDELMEEVPVFTEAEFRQYPMALSLPGMFYEKDIFYTWEEYMEHLHLGEEYQKKHANYTMAENPSPAFRNIQIYIHEGKCAVVSKNKTPAIHFLIRHPKMRDAFESMVIPVMEE